eukprot:sb/3475566/
MAIRIGSTSPSRAAIFTVSSISWLFLLSVSPPAVRIFLANTGQLHILPDWSLVFQKQIFYLNVTFNPIIYTFTNRRFSSFVSRLLCGWGDNTTAHQPGTKSTKVTRLDTSTSKATSHAARSPRLV